MRELTKISETTKAIELYVQLMDFKCYEYIREYKG